MTGANPGVREQVCLFNQVLVELGEPPIEENPHFRLDPDMSSVFRCFYALVKPEAAPLCFWFSVSGLDIGVPTVLGLFGIDPADLHDPKWGVEAAVEMFLTSSIRIRYTNHARRYRVDVFSDDGEIVYRARTRDLLRFRRYPVDRNERDVTYPPAFPKPV